MALAVVIFLLRVFTGKYPSHWQLTALIRYFAVKCPTMGQGNIFLA